jgi:hypothetical protein
VTVTTVTVTVTGSTSIVKVTDGAHSVGLISYYISLA